MSLSWASIEGRKYDEKGLRAWKEEKDRAKLLYRTSTTTATWKHHYVRSSTTKCTRTYHFPSEIVGYITDLGQYALLIAMILKRLMTVTTTHNRIDTPDESISKRRQGPLLRPSSD